MSIQEELELVAYHIGQLVDEGAEWRIRGVRGQRVPDRCAVGSDDSGHSKITFFGVVRGKGRTAFSTGERLADVLGSLVLAILAREPA